MFSRALVQTNLFDRAKSYAFRAVGQTIISNTLTREDNSIKLASHFQIFRLCAEYRNIGNTEMLRKVHTCRSLGITYPSVEVGI